jgi:hypothetical protein
MNNKIQISLDRRYSCSCNALDVQIKREFSTVAFLRFETVLGSALDTFFHFRLLGKRFIPFNMLISVTTD